MQLELRGSKRNATLIGKNLTDNQTNVAFGEVTRQDNSLKDGEVDIVCSSQRTLTEPAINTIELSGPKKLLARVLIALFS